MAVLNVWPFRTCGRFERGRFERGHYERVAITNVAVSNVAISNVVKFTRGHFERGRIISTLEVQAREALWNPQLDLSLRSRRATAQLWKEISEALNGKLSDKEAKTKFKSLHDTYRRIVSKESLASGSERPAKMSKWQHYDNLSFLRDSCLQKQTKSNISCSIDSNDEDSTLSSTDVEPNRQERTRKERNNKKDNLALERIADAFCKRNTEAPIILPDPPENDAIDAIVSVVETRLRKLPQNILDDTAQKLFQLTYELIKNIS